MSGMRIDEDVGKPPGGGIHAGVAVIGTGSIGMRHLSVLRAIKGVRAVAIPQRADRRHALEQEGFSTAASINEAMGKILTHAVIATDTSRHMADAQVALRHGLDVLIEKPMARNSVEARVGADNSDGRHRVFVGCCLRFSESLQTFGRHLSSLGKIHSVRIECQSYLPAWRPQRPYRESYSARADEGGVLRDLIHEIDYAGWLHGWPRAVWARLLNTGKLGIAAEESAELTWEAPGGASVSITLDYLTQPARRIMKASGEHGTIIWDGIQNTVTLALVAAAPHILTSNQTRDEMMMAQMKAFLNMDTDGQSRLVKAEDGIRSLAVCDAARRASADRREVIVEYDG